MEKGKNIIGSPAAGKDESGERDGGREEMTGGRLGC